MELVNFIDTCAKQLIVRISAGHLVFDRLTGDHAGVMPNLERKVDRRPVLCANQERCPASPFSNVSSV